MRAAEVLSRPRLWSTHGKVPNAPGVAPFSTTPIAAFWAMIREPTL